MTFMRLLLTGLTALALSIGVGNANEQVPGPDTCKAETELDLIRCLTHYEWSGEYVEPDRTVPFRQSIRCRFFQQPARNPYSVCKNEPGKTWSSTTSWKQQGVELEIAYGWHVVTLGREGSRLQTEIFIHPRSHQRARVTLYRRDPAPPLPVGLWHEPGGSDEFSLDVGVGWAHLNYKGKRLYKSVVRFSDDKVSIWIPISLPDSPEPGRRVLLTFSETDEAFFLTGDGIRLRLLKRPESASLR